MILVRSPMRVSLIGGGSDYPSYIKANGHGLCINFAIDKYSYIFCRELPPYFKYKTKVVYSEIETVNDNNQIQHNGIRHSINLMKLNDRPLEINHTSDLPTFSGMGSSSAFLIALISALHYLDHSWEMDKIELINKAAFVEQEMMRANVGYQDFCAASMGNLRYFHFDSLGESVSIATKELNKEIAETLEVHGLLAYINDMKRDSSDVVGKYVNNLCLNYYQRQIYGLAEEGLELIEKNFDVEKFGKMLSLSWDYKKHISPNISNERIDYLFNKLSPLIYGGRLLGGGAGGSIFMLASPEKHEEIKRLCQEENLIHIPFSVDQLGSTRII